MNEKYPPPVPAVRHAGSVGRSMSKSRHSPEDRSKYSRSGEYVEINSNFLIF